MTASSSTTRPTARASILQHPVSVLYDVRLAVLAANSVHFAATGAAGWQYLLLAVAIPASLIPLLRVRRGGAVALGLGRVGLDVTLALAFLVGSGIGSLALVYVGATIALAGLRRGADGTVLALFFVTVLFGAAAWWMPEPTSRADAGERVVLLSHLVIQAAVAYGSVRLRSALIAHQRVSRELAHAQVRQAERDERLRLARDMHDSLTKTIHGARLLLMSVSSNVSAPSTPPRLEAATQALQLAQEQSRALLAGLRTDQCDDLAAVVDACVRRLGGAGIETTTQREGALPLLAPSTADEYAKALTELVDNVVRHSGARTARISLGAKDDELLLTVSDDGVGPPALTPLELRHDGHFGLVGVRERMARVGGHLAVESAPGGGTIVRLQGPLRPVIASSAADGVVPLAAAVACEQSLEAS